MEKDEIASLAYDTHKIIWRNRVKLNIDSGPLVEMLHPSIGAAAHGIRYEACTDLGRFGHRGEHFTVAGLLNRPQGLIQVSDLFCETTQRFTGAHELGHYILHDDEVMHRDRPIVGGSLAQIKRTAKEWQADHFAACFLMPEKLVFKAFENRFGSRKPFEFGDNAAYWLRPHDPESVFNSNIDEQAAILATAPRYGGVLFPKLCDEFRVSISAMAIRLIELGLVA